LPRYIEVPLNDDRIVLAEVTGQLDETVPAGRLDDVVGRLPESFSDGLRRVQALADEALAGMRGLDQAPDVVSLEFGLKLSASAGVVVAQSAGEAHVTLSVEWHRRPE
jgi:hypothetical protein